MWDPDAEAILLNEYKSHHHRLKSQPNDSMWRAIAAVIRKNGHQYSYRQCESQWKLLVRRYFATKKSKVKFEYATQIEEILGSKSRVTAYRRGLSSRLRARPKRKFPKDIGESAYDDKVEDYYVVEDPDYNDDNDDNAPSSSATSKSPKNKNKKKQQTVTFASSATQAPAKKKKMDDLKSFLGDFVMKQIETEERSFAKFKAVHDEKVKSLKELLYALGDE